MNIIITGASRGIGYETVKKLSVDSNHTIIAIARSHDQLNQLKEECLSLNKTCNVVPLAFDLEHDVKEALLPQITNIFNKVDILLNNAGALINKPFSQITKKELIHIYNINTFTPFLLIQSLLPLFNPGAHIVNISSMGGFQGSSKFPGLSAYSSSKAALSCLTECLAEELKENNIKVNCLAIGAVQTEMLNKAFPGYQAPLTSSQMAEFISNFCLSGHNYCNGKVLPISLSTP